MPRNQGQHNKLLTKEEDMLCTDLEGVSTESVPEGKKLLAETMLTQLKVKKEQVVELDIAIADKIKGDQEFKEEITNADTYQMTLEEYLTEFIRKTGRPPAES